MARFADPARREAPVGLHLTAAARSVHSAGARKMTTQRLLGILGTVAVLIVIPTIINLITPLTTVQEVTDVILKRNIDFVVWQIVAAGFAILLVGIGLNHLIQTRNETIRRLKQNVESLERHLEYETQMRFIDFVTGVPNEAKWKADIERMAPSVTEQAPCHVALIDLVDFGKLNNELGYAKVDEILKYLAQTIEDGMRRNEGLYRKRAEHGGLRPDRLYRKYPGGDEFYVIVESSEHEMLGLLVRLQESMTNQMEKHIRDHIASKPITLMFSGAVCQLHRDEKPGDLTDRLSHCLQAARYPNAPMRVKWQSGKTSAQCEPDTRERTNYEKAEAMFASKPSQ
jgi:diguanylate cyclase (GGDEF)-like protein